MTNPIINGYLEDDYLEQPPAYLGGSVIDHFGIQVNRVIANFPSAVGVQTNRIIESRAFVGAQVERVIGYELPLGLQVSRQTGLEDANGVQVERGIQGQVAALGMQSTLTVAGQSVSGVQVARTINEESPIGVQVNRQIFEFTESSGLEVRLDKSFPHTSCEELGYLQQGYLETPYLAEGFCVSGPSQVSRTIRFSDANGMQVNRVIEAVQDFGAQVKLIIADFPNPVGFQVELIRAFATAMQVRRVLYNTTNLRIMCDFPSRGALVTGDGNNLMGNPKGTGQNWSASSTAPGDFSPFNLNTDIVEQRWQANGATTAFLTCDTEVAQGTAVDTLAILEHNLTSSSSITIEASNDPAFSSIGQTIIPTWTRQNIWYIAPTFPTQQFRYWRFVISDPTNPDSDGLKVGTIVFGTTVILQGECFIDEVRRSQRHFVDKVPTEGFTNVSNDRALKTAVGMEFRNIRYNRGNYKNLKDIFEYARTSLKCLWVPDPQDPPRFGLFAKVVRIPDETHRNLGSGTDADRVDFSLEIDESL